MNSDTDGDGDNDGFEVFINKTKPLDPKDFVDADKLLLPRTKYGDIPDLNNDESNNGEGTETLYKIETQWENYVSDK